MLCSLAIAFNSLARARHVLLGLLHLPLHPPDLAVGQRGALAFDLQTNQNNEPRTNQERTTLRIPPRDIPAQPEPWPLYPSARPTQWSCEHEQLRTAQQRGNAEATNEGKTERTSDLRVSASAAARAASAFLRSSSAYSDEHRSQR